MQKRHRIFIAINLPSDIKKRLANFEKKWAEIPARWTTPDNLHITVVFLGDISAEDLGQVCMTVKKVALRHQTFTINLQKIAYGPEGKLPPRYIWLGGEHSEGLVALKQDLEDSLTEVVRYKPDNKSFAPHITLARIKEWEWRSIEPEERPEVNEILDTIFTVESLEVMESELTRLGPRYTVIESHQLQ